MIRERGLGRRAISAAALLGACLMVAFTAGPAAAKVIHQHEGSFDGEGAPGGPFGGIISGDAVDLSNGDVYVAESPDPLFLAQSRVAKFNREGVYAGVELTGAGTPHGAFEFASFFSPSTSAIAVDNTAAGPNKGNLYVADTEHHVLDRFSQSGEFLCQIAGSETEAETPAAKECNGAKGSELGGVLTPGGVAVDTSGDVLVTDGAHEAIDEFGPSGELLSQLKDPHLSTELRTVAVDSSGTIYVLSGNPLEANTTVLKFEGGHFASVLDSEPSGAVATDPATGQVYVAVRNGASHARERRVRILGRHARRHRIRRFRQHRGRVCRETLRYRISNLQRDWCGPDLQRRHRRAERDHRHVDRRR
jgi:DNA-binding beta-propeller fold protein YncE